MDEINNGDEMWTYFISKQSQSELWWAKYFKQAADQLMIAFLRKVSFEADVRAMGLRRNMDCSIETLESDNYN